MKRDKTTTWLSVAAICILFAIGSQKDFEEEVIQSMPAETYQAVRANLPEGASQADIVEEYMDNREAYDRACEAAARAMQGLRAGQSDGE